MAPVLEEADVRDRVRRYIQGRFLPFRPNLAIRDDDRLIRSGIVDSLGAIELIKALEAEFGVEIRGEDITEENLGSVTAITRLVLRKRTLLLDRIANLESTELSPRA
jgi:acyl carrier protein